MCCYQMRFNPLLFQMVSESVSETMERFMSTLGAPFTLESAEPLGSILGIPISATLEFREQRIPFNPFLIIQKAQFN